MLGEGNPNETMMRPNLQPSGGTDTAASTPPVSSPELDEFIYLISHDVRGSVRALLELPQWIAEDLQEAGIPVDGSVATSIEMMNRHAGRLDRMLVDLLTYSRIGRMQEVRANDLPTALAQVLEEIPVPAEFDVRTALECASITMGERDLLTLLDALIRNAIKHHDKTRGRIIVTAIDDGDDIVLAVADDGPGIAPEFREKALGAMRTLRPRDEVEGSGMGLAHVAKIAALYGGTVTLSESPYGRGCLVSVRLPGDGVDGN